MPAATIDVVHFIESTRFAAPEVGCWQELMEHRGGYASSKYTQERLRAWGRKDALENRILATIDGQRAGQERPDYSDPIKGQPANIILLSGGTGVWIISHAAPAQYRRKCKQQPTLQTMEAAP